MFLDLWSNGHDTTIFASLDKLPQVNHDSCQRWFLIFNSFIVPIGNTPGYKQPNKHSTRINI